VSLALASRRISYLQLEAAQIEEKLVYIFATAQLKCVVLKADVPGPMLVLATFRVGGPDPECVSPFVQQMASSYSSDTSKPRKEKRRL
jgi:hypothetical protein